MPAYYSVVQLVPDPLADERINVGVIVFGNGEIRSRFLQNWDRVRRFAQHDISYVRGFADWVSRAGLRSAAAPLTPPLPGASAPPRLDEQTIRLMAAEWSNSIQLTPPQLSLEEPETLLFKMTQTHLREPVTRRRQFRDRQDAARLAVRTVRHAVDERLGSSRAGTYVRSDFDIGGKVVPNVRVDLAITNSRIYVASQALSFETHTMADLDRQMRDAIYTLRDVGELRHNIQLDLVALPPDSAFREYRKAEERFRQLPEMCDQIGARLVLEHQIPGWADQIADLVETEIAPHELRAAQA